MNRFEMMQHLEGFKAQLGKLNTEYEAMLADTTSTVEMRNEKMAAVKDVEDRFDAMKAKVEKLDTDAAAKMKNQEIPGGNDADKRVNAKAELIRATMGNKPVDGKVYMALGDNTAPATGGEKLLPKTVSNELLYEPLAKNPLRGKSTFTNITNLEIPKINFSLDDDAFIEDTETAKELKAEGDNVVFARKKFKVFCDLSETIINGTATNLVQTVQSALESGLAKKEKKVAFAATPATGEETMSFYKKTETVYDIKAVTGATMFKAITAALADLEDDYAENATIVMKRVDYFAMISDLANGNASLYTAQPEQVLGAPVEFCDLASVPVVGDLRYSHFNYDENMLFDRDKNVKTGMESFVLTAWIDHKIKLKSAFRLAVVTP